MIKRQRNHPLYLAVAALGVLFTVSACAYGVMAFRDLRGGDAYSAAANEAGLMHLMRQHGGAVLAAEIAALAVAAIAAMATDRHVNRAAELSLPAPAKAADDPANPPADQQA